ncbi:MULTISPECIES: hypothetical protein [unclassified Mammaliicoccus]|uniref:hypothetical protein n=1 Tax=unclassified Mammaliicoccus TaxID=2803851 RepID=UPI001EFB7E0B|nr:MULTISPECIES: hypothetical protein [unclassified Mammaliicoccus]
MNLINYLWDKIEIIFSAIALFISILTYWKHRISYDYKFAKNVYPSQNIILSDGSNDSHGYPDAIVTNLHFINLSSFDISFFELEVYDSETKKRFNLLTKNSIFKTLQEYQVVDKIEKPFNVRNLKIPETKHGLFLSKSLTYFDLIIFPDDDTKNITIEFNIPKKKLFFKNPNKFHPKYVTCGMYYDITGWKESLKQVTQDTLE